MSKSSRIATSIFLALLAVPAPVAAAQHESALSADGALGDATTIRVENLLGSITVHGGAEAGSFSVRGRVVAEGRSDEEVAALAGAVRLRSERDGETLRIVAEVPLDRHTAFRLPKSEGKGRLSRWLGAFSRKGSVAARYDGQPVEVGSAKGAAALAVHLEVHLPYDVDVEVDQVAGAVRCERLRGVVSVSVVDGTLEAVQVNGSLAARTGRAELDVKTFRGESLTLQTGSGDISLIDVVGDSARVMTGSGAVRGQLVRVDELTVDSGSGNVDLSEVEPGTFDLKTASGTVDVAGQLRSMRHGEIHSGSGDVTIRVGHLTSFDLLARTEKGSVKFRDLALELVEEGEDGTHLRHRSGGRELKVTTDKGDVVVRAL